MTQQHAFTMVTPAQLAYIAECDDFGHCLECGADIPFAIAIDGRVLCDPCDREAIADEEARAANPHFLELGARIIATAHHEARHAHAVPDWVRAAL